MPTGSSTVAPSGITACLRLLCLIASISRFGHRFASGLRISAIRSSNASSSTIARPCAFPTTSAVRSSAVGPNPPLVRIKSSPSPAMNRSAPSISPGRSPTIVV